MDLLPPKAGLNLASNRDLDKAEITFCNQLFWLYADGSCYHAHSQTLIVADLHLEKAFSQSSATLLPGYDTIETLELLGSALNRNPVSHCILLGDSFHTIAAAQSLADTYKKQLQHLMVGREFTWVLGNHDPLLPDFLNATQSLSTSIGKIELRHQIEQNDSNTIIAPADGQIIAHYHPKAKLRLRAGTASGKCFIFDTCRMILPAFGVFTGGLNIRDKTISSLFSQAPEIYFCHRTKLYHIRDVANLCK